MLVRSSGSGDALMQCHRCDVPVAQRGRARLALEPTVNQGGEPVGIIGLLVVIILVILLLRLL